MSFVVHSLASGSSGNCMLIRHGRTAFLIDAGIGVRRLVGILNDLQMNPEGLSAILITHEHSDHVAGAVSMSRRFGIPLVANARTLAAILGSGGAPCRVLDPGVETPMGGLCVRSFPISHDAAHPSGYSIEGPGGRICNVTDTGMLTERIREEAAAADLLILESNHDVKMLERGPYPWHLKRRILGDKGHLSNEVASGLIRDLAVSGVKLTVWLAHLSHANNTPQAALSCVQRHLTGCDGHSLTVEVARRDAPSLAWRPEKSGFQLSLFAARRGAA